MGDLTLYFKVYIFDIEFETIVMISLAARAEHQSGG